LVIALFVSGLAVLPLAGLPSSRLDWRAYAGDYPPRFRGEPIEPGPPAPPGLAPVPPRLPPGTVAQAADVQLVSKTASRQGGSDQPLVGETFSYFIIIRNNGPATATGVVLTDMLPPGIEAGQIFGASGMSFSRATDQGTTLTVPIGELAAGATTSVSIQVNARMRGDFMNTADVSALEPDQDSSNNSNSASPLKTTVISHGEFIVEIITSIGALVRSDQLTAQQAAMLATRLRAARDALDRGDRRAAIDQLRSLIDDIDKLPATDGSPTEEQRQNLRAQAQRLLNTLDPPF
jgi:uncharacterized repeat protein (TIGR01451 family)